MNALTHFHCGGEAVLHFNFTSTLLCLRFQVEHGANLYSWWKWLIALEAEQYFNLPFVWKAGVTVDVWKGHIY